MLKFSRKPLMIAGGCSFTDPNFKSLAHPELDTSWDKWPAIFAKQYNYDLINVGRSGAGNEYIADTIIDAVNKNQDVKLVMALWSGWDRFQVYSGAKTFFCPLNMASAKINGSSKVLSDKKQSKICLKEPKFKIKYEICESVIDNYFDTDAILNSNMRSMWILQDFLKKRNIKYIFAQGVNPIQLSFFNEDFTNKTIKPLLNDFLEHMYYDDLDTLNFYGWPLIPIIGGTHLDSMIYQNGNELKISNEDGHPNAKGQKELAKIFSEAYQKNYA